MTMTKSSDESPRYEVQTEMLGTWENCWTNDDGLPITFASKEAAEEAMRDHIIDCEDAFEGGYCLDAIDPSSLPVVPVRFL
jgi:hypothetical protein